MKIKLVDNELAPYIDMCHFIDPDQAYWSREEENPDVIVGVARHGLNELKNYTGTAKKALVIIEPSIVNGEMYRDAVLDHEHYDYLFTHQKHLKDKLPEGKFVFLPHGATIIKQEDIKIHNKTKLVNFIFSDKQWNAGHRYRHAIYKEIKDLVECHGSGVDGVRVPYKGDVLTPYAFSIAMENERSEDYFTEKIIDCFLTGTVPIYYGTPNIGNYFNSKGILTFESHQDLIELINGLSFEKYNELQEAVLENFNIAQDYKFISKPIYNFFKAL